MDLASALLSQNPLHLFLSDADTNGDGIDRIDRVQQYSEKRTCITATPADDGDARYRRRDSSGVENASLGGAKERPSGLAIRQYDSLSDIGDLPDLQERPRVS